MGFDQFKTMIQTGFLMEPCHALHDPNLTGNANVISKQYIDSSRIKEWKPADPNAIANRNLDPNIKYCYINNDAAAGVKDYAMAARSCSKTEPIFSVPFISEVFEDANIDKTMTYPINKCVLAIDKSKVSTERLTQFWNGFGSTECTQVNLPLANSLSDTQSDLERQKRALAERTTQYSQCTKLNRELQVEKQDLSTQYTTMTASNQTCNQLYGQSVEAHKTTQSVYATYKRDAESTVAGLESDKKILGTSLKQTIDERDICTDQKEKVAKQFAVVSAKLIDEQKNLSTANATINIMQGRVDFVTKERAQFEINYKKCNEERLVIQQRLQESDAELKEYKPMGLKYPQCDVERNACNKNLERCETEQALCENSVNDAMIKLNGTLRENASLVAVNKEMAKELERLRNVAADLRACMTDQAKKDAIIKTLTDDINGYVDQIKTMKKRFMTIEEATASSMIASVEKQLPNVCTNSAFKRQNESYVKQFADMTTQMKNMANAGDNCIKQLKICNSNLEITKTDLQKMTADRDAWRNRYNPLFVQHQAALNDIQNLTNQVDACNRALKPMREERDDWKRKYEAMEIDRNYWKRIYYEMVADRDKWYRNYNGMVWERDTARWERDVARGERDWWIKQRNYYHEHYTWYNHNWDNRYNEGKKVGCNECKSTDRLMSHRELSPNDVLVSPNGRYRLVNQGDGNVVLYGDGRSRWHSDTWRNQKGGQLAMQSDGNLVLYIDGRAVWSSRTNRQGTGPYSLIVGDDGKVRVIDTTCRVLWSS